MIPHTENLPLEAFLHTMVYKKTAIPAILSSDMAALYAGHACSKRCL